MTNKVQNVGTALYNIDLRYVDSDVMKEAVAMAVTTPEFQEVAEKRMGVFDQLRKAIARRDDRQIKQFVHTLEDRDKKMRHMLWNAVAQTCLVEESHHKPETLSYEDLLRNVPEDQRERAVALAEKLDSATFMMDIIETLLFDIKTETPKLLGDDIHFHQFDSALVALERVTTLLHKTRDVGTDEEKELFADTADSITAYVMKRIATFQKRLKALNKKNSSTPKKNN